MPSNTKTKMWPDLEYLEKLRDELQQYVAVQTQFGRVASTIESKFKSDRIQKQRVGKALTILIERHNIVGRELNKLKSELDLV